MKLAAWALAAALLAPAPALAGEVFLGGYAHDIDDSLSIGHTTEGGAQIIGGYRTGRIEGLRFLGKPQAHVLGAVNTRGGINYAAAGFDWRIRLWSDRFYFRPGIGLAVHSGEVNFPSPYDPNISNEERIRRLQRNDLDLGSKVLAQLELGLGWQVTDKVSAELSWIHLSHGQLAGEQNPGLGDLGARVAYKF